MAASTAQAGWTPYAGFDALLLALLLFACAGVLLLMGKRLSSERKLRGPGRTGGYLILATWVVSLIVLLLVEAILRGLSPQRPQVPSPIEPITLVCGLGTFVIIAYLTRASGVRVALASAFVGTAAAPMIFELPFDLIVFGRANAPFSIALVFFTPLFLVEVSTLSLLQLSPATTLTKRFYYSLGGVFAVFGVWAVFGFAYPSDPISFTLNGISKVLSFVAAITLFYHAADGGDGGRPVS